ncbi:hypothetical protein Pen01_01290 [Phytomonospora endophytica]|nr:hypothetical protein Pen01_01290 [Phytomonospora endophytica]
MAGVCFAVPYPAGTAGSMLHLPASHTQLLTAARTAGLTCAAAAIAWIATG